MTLQVDWTNNFEESTFQMTRDEVSFFWKQFLEAVTCSFPQIATAGNTRLRPANTDRYSLHRLSHLCKNDIHAQEAVISGVRQSIEAFKMVERSYFLEQHPLHALLDAPPLFRRNSIHDVIGLAGEDPTSLLRRNSRRKTKQKDQYQEEEKVTIATTTNNNNNNHIDQEAMKGMSNLSLNLAANHDSDGNNDNDDRGRNNVVSEDDNNTNANNFNTTTTTTTTTAINNNDNNNNANSSSSSSSGHSKEGNTAVVAGIKPFPTVNNTVMVCFFGETLIAAALDQREQCFTSRSVAFHILSKLIVENHQEAIEQRQRRNRRKRMELLLQQRNTNNLTHSPSSSSSSTATTATTTTATTRDGTTATTTNIDKAEKEEKEEEKYSDDVDPRVPSTDQVDSPAPPNPFQMTNVRIMVPARPQPTPTSSATAHSEYKKMQLLYFASALAYITNYSEQVTVAKKLKAFRGGTLHIPSSAESDIACFFVSGWKLFGRDDLAIISGCKMLLPHIGKVMQYLLIDALREGLEGIEVHEWDERFSTVAVERVLIDADLSRKRRKASTSATALSPSTASSSMSLATSFRCPRYAICTLLVRPPKAGTRVMLQTPRRRQKTTASLKKDPPRVRQEPTTAR